MHPIPSIGLHLDWPWAIAQQVGAGWAFDFASFAIGVAAAFLLIFVIYRSRHQITHLWNRVKEKAGQLRQRLTANMATRYSANVIESAQAMHLFGSFASLDNIYVESQLRAPLAPPSGPFEPLTISPEQALNISDRLVIIGEQGSGRTMLLSQLLLLQARRVHAAAEKERVPIYVYLPVLAVELNGTADDVPQANLTAPDQQLVKTSLSSISRLVATGVARWLRRQVEIGNALILLDGWDEVQRTSQPIITAWIQELLSVCPGNRLLVTAGERGYGPLLDAGFVLLEPSLWSHRQLSELAQRWASAWPRRSDGANNAVPSISYALTPPTPLEATINIIIQLCGQPSVGTPAGKMARVMSLLLPPPETDDKGDAAWPLEAGHRALGLLALTAIEQDRMTLARSEIQAAVTESMPSSQFALNEEQEYELTKEESKTARDEQDRRTLQIVDCCRALTAIGAPIRSWDNQLYHFPHPLVTAFLAARHLASEDIPVIAYALDPAWTHVLRFYVGLATTEPIVERLLGAPDDLFLNNLWKAAALSAASTRGDEPWRSSLIKRLAQLFLNPRLPVLLRDRCLAALVDSGEGGVALLFRREAENRDAGLRAGAILGLGGLGSEQDLRLIDSALVDPDPQVRLSAINALIILAHKGSEAAKELVVVAMVEAEDNVQRLAVEALAEFGPEGHAILRDGAEDQDLIVRRAAAYGLAAVDEPWAKELLLKMQREDSEWLVRNAATEALGIMEMRGAATPPDVDLALPKPESESWLISWAAERGEGTGVGDAALNTLMRALVEGDTSTRQHAVDTLRRLADPRTVDVLRRTLRDPGPLVRQSALVALDEISHRQNVTITAA